MARDRCWAARWRARPWRSAVRARNVRSGRARSRLRLVDLCVGIAIGLREPKLARPAPVAEIVHDRLRVVFRERLPLAVLDGEAAGMLIELLVAVAEDMAELVP